MENQTNNDIFSEYIISPIYSATETVSDNITKATDSISNGFASFTTDGLSTITSPITDGISSFTSPIAENVSSTIDSLDKATENVFDTTMDTIRNEDNILMTLINSIIGNWFRILLVVGIIFLFMILITTKSVFKGLTSSEREKKEEREKETINLVVKEGLTTKEKSDLLDSMKKGFCKVNSGDSSKLNKECKKLTKDVCNMTECCVYAKTGNKESCMAGDELGPTYQYDDKDNKINFDYYYYMGKCSGDC
jgi:hypothetical protein